MRRITAFVVAVVAMSGAVVIASSAAGAVVPSAGGYVPIAARRVVDTRVGTGVAKGAIAGQHAVKATITAGGLIPANAQAIQATVTAVTGTVAGGVTLWKPGTARPSTTNLLFGVNQVVSNTAIVQVLNGQVDIFNSSSSGSVQVILDISGYYAGGAFTNTPGDLNTIAPTRIVNTPANIGHTGAVPANGYVVVYPSVPRTAMQVAIDVTVVSPTRAGSVVAYPGGVVPTLPTVVFPAAGRVTSFAVVALSSGGGIVIRNTSTGTVQLAVDLLGYFSGGTVASVAAPPTTPGSFQALPGKRVYSHTVAANTLTGVSLAGIGGLPVDASQYEAVLVRVQVVSPTSGGSLIAFPGEIPPVRSLSYSAHVTASNELLVSTSGGGSISLYNSIAATVTVDLYGYVRRTLVPPTAPPAFISRNVHSFGGKFQDGSATGDGCQDANKGYHFVLLHLGAQATNKTGIVLSGASMVTLYADVVAAVKNYILAFTNCGGTGTIAVATNNDAIHWDTYTAAQRGQDFANKVINALPTGGLNGFAGPSVVGAFDAEEGFGTHKLTDASTWESNFTSHVEAHHVTPNLPAVSKIPAGKKLIFTGSADGCPTAPGSTAVCSNGWTLAQIYALASAGGTLALPQVYTIVEAAQWANVDRAGGGALAFVGSLTQQNTCAIDGPSTLGCPTLSAADGYAALYSALSGIMATPVLPYSIDLTDADNG